eukprot:UN00775
MLKVKVNKAHTKARGLTKQRKQKKQHVHKKIRKPSHITSRSTASFTTTTTKIANNTLNQNTLEYNNTSASFGINKFKKSTTSKFTSLQNILQQHFGLNIRKFSTSTTPDNTQKTQVTDAPVENATTSIQSEATTNLKDNTQVDNNPDAPAAPEVVPKEQLDAANAAIKNAVDGTAPPTTSAQPAYAQFKRIIGANGSHKFEPTESYFDENGDECLVIYEASPEIVTKTLLERRRALLNLLAVAPGVALGSGYFIPAPYSYVMYAACAIVMAVNFARVYGLSAFVTKITAVWPQNRTEITSKLHNNLQEALMGLTPLPGESPFDLPPENEFQQRQKHNETILKKLKEEEEAKNRVDENGNPIPLTEEEVQKQEQNKAAAALEKLNAATKAQEKTENNIDDDDDGPTQPVYPQPGVDPMGRLFTFNPQAPDVLTWKFGWSDATQLHRDKDIPPLWERQNFAEQTRLWSQLPDPDFPEYLYVDRLNNGKNFLYQKVPLSSLAAVWSVPVVPPAIPQVTPTQIEGLQGIRHDAQAILLRADNTVTGLFPKFIKHDVAFNQLIFAANINARNEVKEKFEHVRGRMKL